VYVDNDPIVLAHAHKLKSGSPQGASAYIDGDLRDTDSLLRQAAETLSLDQPVALLLLGVLHLISDQEDPYAIVSKLVRAVPPGSYLVISHPASDLLPDTQHEASRQYNQRVATHQRLRSREEVARFFDGLTLVEPGLVQWHQWRPDPHDDVPADAVSGHSGVARIP
jgi:O-methyltransferase involved in polyketide biosynthesis